MLIFFTLCVITNYIYIFFYMNYLYFVCYKNASKPYDKLKLFLYPKKYPKVSNFLNDQTKKFAHICIIQVY